MTQEHPGSSAQIRLVKLRIPGQNEHLLLVTEAITWRVLENGSGHSVTSNILVKAWYVSGPLRDDWKVAIAIFDGKTLGGNRVKVLREYVRIEPVELQGLGLGSYLFAKIVRWAQQLEPNTEVEQVRLHPNQATDIASRDRRNGFYEKFGFKFDYRPFEGMERAGGISLPMTVADLILPVPQSEPRLHKSKGVIEEVDLPRFMQGAQLEITRLNEKLKAEELRHSQERKHLVSQITHLVSQKGRADARRTRFWWAIVSITIAAAAAYLAWHRPFAN